MTEEELYDHLRSTLVDDEDAWPLDPICHGDWKPFSKSEATRILARLSAEQLARSENPIPFHARVRRLRGTTLPLYPGYILIEGEAKLMESSSLATFNCVLGQKGLRVLTWHSSDVLRLNRKVGLNLKYNADYKSYLFFYSAIATGNDGRFRIYEPSDPIPWRDDADDIHKVLVVESLQEMSFKTSADGRCLVEVSAIYGSTLYKATFAIGQTGQVEVSNREVLLEQIHIRPETFFGPFKLYR